MIAEMPSSGRPSHGGRRARGAVMTRFGRRENGPFPARLLTAVADWRPLGPGFVFSGGAIPCDY